MADIKNRKELSQEYLYSVLNYNCDSGVFTWNKGKKMKGKIAGYVNPNGYIYICINRIDYLAHRLAWFYVTGTWPIAEIDHKNCTPSDNRFENLREANRSQNAKNVKPRYNENGYKGVRFNKYGWSARIGVDGKTIHLGTFRTPELAHAAYCEAAKKYHGEYARAS